MINTELRIAKFSASNISRLLAGGSGKTSQSYILELALQAIGIKDDIDTSATRHGLNNQFNAYQKVVLPLYPEATWLDEFLPINEFCGASPDVLIGYSPMDIKCPYNVDAYIEQINSVPTKYYQQVQMQMLACKSDTGYLCFYLTRPELWGEEEWQEYPIELEKRYKIFELKTDEELQNNILKKVEESEPKKQWIVNLLLSAKELSFEEYFHLQWNGNKLRNIKDCSNIYKLTDIFRVGNNFYYEV
ncbi:MAG: hypothetical protein RIR01_1377 [Bacteroidota bacterium]|jgi:hypothetical protein